MQIMRTGGELPCGSRSLAIWATLFLLGSQATIKADDWPQWLGPRRDGVWRETGILGAFPPDGPKIRWRTPIGEGYSGPAVAGNRVYVTDRILAEGASNPGNPFAKGRIAGSERILCLDDENGQIVWKHEYDCPYTVSYPAGPRATPAIDGDYVYALGTMGDLFCLEKANGHVAWSRNLPKEFGCEVPLWGFAAHPLVDGEKLICLVGGEGSTVVALEKKTGKEIWRALSAKEPGYAPPMIFQAGGKRQLIVWHPEAVNSLDPETGKVYWTQPFIVKAALSVPTPRQDGDHLLVTSFYNGSLMMKLDPDKPAASVLWQGKSQSERPDRTDGLHSIMPTPFIKDGYIYGICSHGELRCLKEDTGQRVWESLLATGSHKNPANDRWKNAFLVQQADRFFLFTEGGDLLIALLTPEGYKELGRAHLLDPTNKMPGRLVVWSHPAFAHRNVYARNDKEIVSASLAAP